MTALVQHELGPFTVDDWHALPAREDGTRLELIEGYWLVTPPPSGQHQWTESEILGLLKSALQAAGRTDLYALGGIGVEISTTYRTAVIPDFIILDTPPIGTSFDPSHVLLVGEIWSPGNSSSEQRQKFDSFARAGVPFFWSVAQDGRGPTELVAYRLERGYYIPELTAKAGEGSVSITASPVPVELDVAALRV
ncbi:Uma2 family endonuclease [Halopolyspora algeriensis]|uniref:Uma2 family endonuclease n=1 Tax=Halopolyspora algeriensis TaxID=1500506 RepID=A0A368VS78_9ACTN|nr:Uma2 family endonuclease [Halopolyspora algeriensis]RCW43975.1 Uma2 family endonuclease [Halopolyspora algeriensis]TQM53522.1 Uma2 family endonuclease [Halopolyspora algeriensis]